MVKSYSDLFYAAASVERPNYISYYISKDEKTRLAHFKKLVGKLPDKNTEIDHNLEFQEIRGILKGDKPKDISQEGWGKYKNMVSDKAEVGTLIA